MAGAAQDDALDALYRRERAAMVRMATLIVGSGGRAEEIVHDAFLAMAETALTRINRVKALTLSEEGRRGATALLKLVDHPERFLNPVLLLVLLCHLLSATLVGILAERSFGAGGGQPARSRR